jgi:hypothetical protein
MENRSSGFMSSLRAFGGGLFTGTISGALMAGVYALVAASFYLTGLTGLPFMSPIAAAGVVAMTAIFTGIMGVYRDYQHRKQSAHGEMREGHIAAASPGMVPVLVPSVAAERASVPAQKRDAPGRHWSGSVGRESGQDRIQEILNNRSLDDKGRAAAILQEREARTAANAPAAR